MSRFSPRVECFSTPAEKHAMGLESFSKTVEKRGRRVPRTSTAVEKHSPCGKKRDSQAPR
jgi:hypothetical protein